MTTWTCPRCNLEVEALATEVGHACPNHRQRWVRWVKAEAVA